ncbi:MAG: hypothetical protein HJJLKODD_02157 [Phycisphaerae bacterium]|nr:hypothetical protein [Phycisphaerae bacterium]
MEMDGQVVLREGYLELVACSRQTREHESIICVQAKPMHIYQALGLLGLEPGQPPLWDWQAQRVLPPWGSAVEISVRYEQQGEIVERPVQEWLINPHTQRTPRRLYWLFSGSQFDDQQQLLADGEGTVISLVDFDSSILTLPRSFSSNNSELIWQPHPEHVPPLQTRCTLLIQPLNQRLLVVGLDSCGDIYWRGQRSPTSDLGRLVGISTLEPQNLCITVKISSGLDPAQLQMRLEQLYEAGVARKNITIRPASPEVLQQAVVGLVAWSQRLVFFRLQNNNPGSTNKAQEKLPAAHVYMLEDWLQRRLLDWRIVRSVIRYTLLQSA